MSDKKHEFTVHFPFIHVGSKSDEVTIISENIYYSEINECGYGIQLNKEGEKNREEVKKLCFDISEKFKKLNKLINNEESLMLKE